MSRHRVKISKLLSLVLRHNPDAIGIRLDEEGWVGIPELLQALARNGHSLSIDELHEIVRDNDKQRFRIKDNRIRANQGHSIEIELNLESREPPSILYHGTAAHNLASIQQFGLLKMKRQYVHLSPDQQTARKVGMRHGEPLIFVVRSGEMWQAGHAFYRSHNGVWLTESVPSVYLEVISD